MLSLLAGSVGGFGNLDGPAAINRLHQPGAVVVDAQGNTFIADTGNHVIRKLDGAGVLSTLAGLPGFPGSADGKGSEARFASPAGIALDGSGGLFVADSFNHTIRRVGVDGTVTTVAGEAGEDGKPVLGPVAGSAARFNTPIGLAFDGQALYIADSENHAIRVLLADGTVAVLAGSVDGLAGDAVAGAVPRLVARFRSPTALALTTTGPSAGVLWVSDTFNSVVRKVKESLVHSATPLPAQPNNVNKCQGLAVDPVSGEALVFDASNILFRVGAALTGATIVKLSASDPLGDADGPLEQASFNAAIFNGKGLSGGLAFDSARQRFVVADAFNHLLRAIALSPAPGQVSTIAGQRRALIGDTNATTGAAARFNDPISLAATAAGAALVGQAGTDATSVRHLLSSGAVTDRFVDSTGLDCPPRAAVETTNGVLYIFDRAVALIVRDGLLPMLVLHPNSAAPIQDGAPGVGRFGLVGGVVVDSLGRAVFADVLAHAVRYLTPNGALGRIAGRYDLPGFETGDALDEALFDRPIDVAIAPDDTIYVLDAGNLAVFRIAPGANGQLRVTVVAANFEDPRALALDAAGHLYVAEGQSHTLVRISKTGERKTVAGLPDRRGFVPGALPGALALPPRSNDAADTSARVGMRVIGNRLLLTMEQAVVQITPLPA